MDILFDLYKIYSPSHREVEMSAYIQNFLESRGIAFDVDRFGQVFSIKQGTPLLSAHMDQVQKQAPTDLITLQGNIYGFNHHRQVGLGADDKNGIYIILKILTEIDPSTVSFMFSSGEEAGGKVGFIPIEHHPYCLVLDRKGSGDIIGTGNCYCESDLEDAILKIGERFKYKKAFGVFSDADNLSNHTPSVNLSVGYYNAHTDYEYTNIKNLNNALAFVKQILTDLPRVSYQVPDKSKRWKKYSGYGFGKGGSGGYSGFGKGSSLASGWDAWGDWEWEMDTEELENQDLIIGSESRDLEELYGVRVFDPGQVGDLKSLYQVNPPEIHILGCEVFVNDQVFGTNVKVCSALPTPTHVFEVTCSNFILVLENVNGEITAHMDLGDGTFEQLIVITDNGGV